MELDGVGAANDQPVPAKPPDCYGKDAGRPEHRSISSNTHRGAKTWSPENMIPGKMLNCRHEKDMAWVLVSHDLDQY